MDHTEIYTTPVGAVHIEIDDAKCTIKDAAGSKIGNIDFNWIEEVDGSLYLLLTNAYIEGAGGIYQGHGVGTKCVELVGENYDVAIVARAHDGIERSDGSHLTGNAPSWVAGMHEKGLLFQQQSPSDCNDPFALHQ